MLTNSLVKTGEGLQKMSVVDEQQISVNLSAPQLVEVLGRLTLALKAPEQKVNSNGDQGFTRLLAFQIPIS